MNWLFLALLSTAMVNIVVFVDKYIVSKRIKDYRAIPIYTAIIGVCAGIFFWFITGFPILSLPSASFILLSGVFQSWAAVTYFKALSKNDASGLTILFQMTPIIILILSLVFLKETISFKQYLGFIIIFIASILVSVKKSQKKFRLSEAFFLILLSDFLYGASAVLAKFTIDANSLQKVLSYESWGVGVGGLALYLFFPSIRMSFKRTLKNVKGATLGILIGNEVLFVVSKAVQFVAFSLGSVTLISVITSGTQSFLAIFLGFLLTILAPQIITEDISGKNLGKKIGAGILLVIGIILIS